MNCRYLSGPKQAQQAPNRPSGPKVGLILVKEGVFNR